jgi:hypothetical protein
MDLREIGLGHVITLALILWHIRIPR